MDILSRLPRVLTGNYEKRPGSLPPTLLRFRSSKRFICWTVCFAIFCDIICYSIVLGFLDKALRDNYHVSGAKLERVNAAMMYSSSAGLFLAAPVAGIFADAFGSRRAPMVVGLVALAISNVLLCFAANTTTLIVGRAFQGASAGVVWSVGLALIVDTYGEKKEGGAIAWTGAAMSLGLLIAPPLGSAVFERVGWRPVFVIPCVAVVVDLALRLIIIEKKVAKDWEEKSSGANTPHREEGRSPSANPSTNTNAFPIPNPTSDIGSLERKPLKSCKEYRHAARVVFTSPRLLADLFAIVMQSSVILSFDSILGLFAKEYFGWGSGSGTLFIPIYITNLLFAAFLGQYVDKKGAKWLVVAGFVCCTPTILALQLVDREPGVATPWNVAFCIMILFLTGSGLTFANVGLASDVSATIHALHDAEPGVFGRNGVTGLGYGLHTQMFAVGGVVGPTLAIHITKDKVTGWFKLSWILTIFAMAGIPPSVGWVGGPLRFPEPSSRRQAAAAQAEPQRRARRRERPAPPHAGENTFELQPISNRSEAT